MFVPLQKNKEMDTHTIINDVVCWMGLLVACIGSMATVVTMLIKKNELKPNISK